LKGGSMEELKPCPFCGGEARLEDLGYPHHVYCISCGVGVTGVGCGIEGEASACEKWNRRINGWIPVSDPPKEKDKYLCCLWRNTKKKEKGVRSLLWNGTEFEFEPGMRAWGVISWMPLPATDVRGDI